MKGLYLFFTALFISAVSFAQYSDDFESYTVDDYIGVESDQWTTWSGSVGGGEDAQVSDAEANSGSNSLYFVSGTGQDVVLLFDSLYTEDLFNFSCYFYIPDGNAAYFNIQGTETIGETWAIDVYMNNDASITVSNSGTNHVVSTYPNDQWFKIEFAINLTLNNWEFLIDDVSEGTWVNGVNAVSMVDFYPATADDLFYVDDVAFEASEYVLPDLNANVQAVSIGAIGVVGQERLATVSVGNAGQQEINSFDLEVSYGSETVNISESGLTLASLESIEIVLDDAVTLLEGENDMTATVSNVNAMGEDDYPDDDSGVNTIDPAVAALGKVVIGEEGTGTWCGWCPRGTVAMDFMANNYHDYYYGIAVHNGDPMVVPSYDDGLGFTAFPGAMVDRISVIDPGAIEIDFVERVEEVPAATITTGAEIVDEMLMVSLNYEFLEDISGNYKVLCVLTEDGVTGTSSSYAQANYYSGGGAGPMGGYEDLANPVPAADMVYDHVARALIPESDGLDNSFPDGATAGSSHVFNFAFPISSDWNTDNMHIIGMLIQSNGDINNGGGSTIAQAIDNGYMVGEEVVGIVELDGIISNFEVYPNPASNNATLALNLEIQQEVTLQMVDISGKVIMSRSYGQMEGSYQLPMNLSNVNSGMYFVNLLIGDKMITQKLIVE